jgi:hypothetical protein
MSPDISKISAALARAQGKLGHPKKDKTGQVGQQKTKYADMESVVDCIKQVLAEEGIAYWQPLSSPEPGLVACSTVLMCEGQWLAHEPLVLNGGNTAQSMGSACTYARRYTLLGAFGLAPEDDDGAAASIAPPPPRSRQQRPAPRDEAPAAEDPGVARVRKFFADMTDKALRDQLLAEFREQFGCNPRDLPPARVAEAESWLAEPGPAYDTTDLASHQAAEG